MPRGTLGESCAIMSYLCNKHGLDQFYPTDPAERAHVDNAMFYLIGTLYPYLARATYPTLGFPSTRARSAPRTPVTSSRRRPSATQQTALADPLEAYEKLFIGDRTFIGGDKPSIADIRLAASLEFLRAIDYDSRRGRGVPERGRVRSRRRLLRARRRRARVRGLGQVSRLSGAIRRRDGGAPCAAVPHHAAHGRPRADPQPRRPPHVRGRRGRVAAPRGLVLAPRDRRGGHRVVGLRAPRAAARDDGGDRRRRRRGRDLRSPDDSPRRHPDLGRPRARPAPGEPVEGPLRAGRRRPGAGGARGQGLGQSGPCGSRSTTPPRSSPASCCSPCSSCAGWPRTPRPPPAPRRRAPPRWAEGANAGGALERAARLRVGHNRHADAPRPRVARPACRHVARTVAAPPGARRRPSQSPESAPWATSRSSSPRCSSRPPG